MGRTFLAALAAAGLFWASAAGAATSGIEAESLGDSPVQQTRGVCVSVASDACVMTFPAVPQKERLVVVNMACFWTFGPGGHLFLIRLGDPEIGSPIHATLLQFPPDPTGTYAFDLPTTAIYDAGNQPQLVLVNHGGVGTWLGGQCTITGYRVVVP